MTITEENPIRLLDLNKYPLSEEQANDKELVQWTKEIIHTFTTNTTGYSNFKNTVEKNVFELPVGAKLKKYGARYFVMKEQCAMTDEEITKLRKEAPNKYSPYWYGMISTCHFSGHITLKIAQMLFPLETWNIISTFSHTFVTNLTRSNIIAIFGDTSSFAKEVNATFQQKYKNTGAMPPSRWSVEYGAEMRMKNKEVAKLLSPYIADRAEYKKASPMIIDLLATDKDTFLELVARAKSTSITEYNSAINYRKSLTSVGNIRKIPITMKLRNYFYKDPNEPGAGGAAGGGTYQGKGGRRRTMRQRKRTHHTRRAT